MNRNKVLWIVVAVFVLLVLVRVFSMVTSSKQVSEERIIPVVVTSPKIGTVQEKLTLVGDVKGETEVVVRPKTGGRVEEIYVKEGDDVKAGEKLLAFVAGIKPDDELYRDLVTFSPISGVVGVQSIKLGEQVQAGSGSPSPVFTIYKIDNVKIYVNVPEKYFSFVSSNTYAEISLDAFPGRVFRGKVGNIRPVIDPMTRTTQAEIIIPNPDHRIKPGMFSRVDLVLRYKPSVMILPSDSVLGLDVKYVFVVVDGKAAMKKVTTGIQEGDDIEITSGIKTSDEVIIVGQRVVGEGSKVKAETR
jgi:membrane fusion protein (multidrug efflux system)